MSRNLHSVRIKLSHETEASDRARVKISTRVKAVASNRTKVKASDRARVKVVFMTKVLQVKVKDAFTIRPSHESRVGDTVATGPAGTASPSTATLASPP